MDVNVVGEDVLTLIFAWLWTLGQTVRKSGRTFSNVLRLMERFLRPQVLAKSRAYNSISTLRTIIRVFERN